MEKAQNFGRTIRASYAGYVVQAIINNFAPLLFLTFENSYGINSAKIAFLITLNFGCQLLIDYLSALFIDRLGQRICIVAAHIFAALGLIGLGTLPDLMPNPYAGLVISIITYAVGSGLIEVMVSPLVEACPTKNKGAAMSLLHSFYCWGQVFVVLISTLFFVAFGIENWKILSVLWAILPLINGVVFMTVPLATLTEDGKSQPFREIARHREFWAFIVMMMCAGAGEIAISQWASAFAEAGLGVNKTFGDLLGPCAFAILMGLARLMFGIFGARINLKRFMLFSAILCVVSYLITSLAPQPIVALLGCALCGLSVGIMWPGTLSLASARLPKCGTAMFSFLALAGDLGCASGPAIVGVASDMRTGILYAIVFPVALTVLLAFLNFSGKRKKQD